MFQHLYVRPYYRRDPTIFQGSGISSLSAPAFSKPSLSHRGPVQGELGVGKAGFLALVRSVGFFDDAAGPEQISGWSLVLVSYLYL